MEEHEQEQENLALRLQLTEIGDDYSKTMSEETRERLVHTLQTNDCRKIVSSAVDGDVLSTAFVRSHHVDLFQTLLDNGMNVDIKDAYGWTALINTSRDGHEDCVRLLLDHHANVDVQNRFGFTALMLASNNKRHKILEMLLQSHANPDIQGKDDGMTALMWASEFGHREIVQLLLNHNADIELKNNKGKTALDLTHDEEIKEMIRNHVPTTYILK